MKHLIILLLLCLQASLLDAQNNTDNQSVSSEKDVRYNNLDVHCEFLGGNQNYFKWIDANIRIPEGFTGSEVVVIRCKILPDGTVTEPTPVRQRQIENAEVNAEAMRLVSLMPKM